MASAIFISIPPTDVWYGISVTTIWSAPERDSVISATARSFTEPRPGSVGVEQPGSTEDERSGREIGTFDVTHQLVGRRLWVLEKMQRRVDDLTEVVRRDICRHPDRDALRAVDEQVRVRAGRTTG